MEKLDQILRSFTVAPDEDKVQHKLLGAGFVVVDKNGILYEGASGRLSFDPKSAPFKIDSVVWLASVCKLVTVTAMLQLVERGLLTMEQDLRPLVPELAAMQILRGFDADGAPQLEPNPRPITLQHLLTHTVGLNFDLADPDLLRWSKHIGRTAVNLDWNMDAMNTPLKFEPGDGWMYGSAVDWAGHVLTVVTGRGLGDWMEENLFGPLGMRSTGFWPERIPGAADNSLELAFAAKDPYWGVDPYPDETLQPGESILRKEHDMEFGGVGIFSTPHDHALFLSALLACFVDLNVDDKTKSRLLGPQTMAQLFRPQLNESQRAMLEATVDVFRHGYGPEFPIGTNLTHGLGGFINLDDLEGKRAAGSMTWSGMSNGRWWMDPKTGIAAAMYTNVLPWGNAVTNRLWDELEQAVYGELLPSLKRAEAN